jgi:hypothetical protein
MHLEMLLTLPCYPVAMFAFASAVVGYVNPRYDIELVKMNHGYNPERQSGLYKGVKSGGRA